MEPILVPSSQPAGDRSHKPASWLSLLYALCQAPGYLPGHIASPLFGHYQVILLGDYDLHGVDAHEGCSQEPKL